MRGFWGDLMDAPDSEKMFVEVVALLPADAKTPMEMRLLNRLRRWRPSSRASCRCSS
jgi:hypothetical protein